MKKDEIIINGKKFKPYISKEKIDNAIAKIADEINRDYFGRKPVFLAILKGSIFFAADLLRKINLDCTLETISAQSYGQSLESSGNVDIKYQNIDIKNKDVIIVEDIIDTGLTLTEMTKELLKLEPKSIETACLLSKPDARKNDIEVKYLGFEIDNLFVIGMGLDYAQHGRQLPYIYIAED